jgi:hypothetical protein
MLNVASINQMGESQLRDLAHQLMTQLADQSKQLTQFSSLIAQRDADIAQCQADIAQLDQTIEAKEQRILMLTHVERMLAQFASQPRASKAQTAPTSVECVALARL